MEGKDLARLWGGGVVRGKGGMTGNWKEEREFITVSFGVIIIIKYVFSDV